MGTRADFYTKKNDKQELEWLGSIAFDGYPEGIDTTVLEARKEDFYLKSLDAFFADRDDVSLPKDGWPWPWDDSELTDCAYLFTGEKVVMFKGRGEWIDAARGKDEDAPTVFRHALPDMKDKKQVTFGKRSGLIVVRDEVSSLRAQRDELF